jgi:hypothetical protein
MPFWIHSFDNKRFMTARAIPAPRRFLWDRCPSSPLGPPAFPIHAKPISLVSIFHFIPGCSQVVAQVEVNIIVEKAAFCTE